MYAAFNTLQLELERLTLLRESMERSPSGQHEVQKLKELDIKILDHEQAIKVLVRENQSRGKGKRLAENCLVHHLGGTGLG